MLRLALCMLATAGIAQAQVKIGIVDAEVVIQKCAKGKAFFEAYQKEVKAKQGDIDTMIETYRAKEKDAQAKAASMSQEALSDLRAELQRLQTDIKRKQEDYQREMQIKLDGQLEQFRRELAPLIRQVAQEQGLDLVLNYGPETNIVFISDKINITSTVTQKYDEMQ
ncbi:MAG: OmpH family outer membrane protein [Acidobacteria bacterium]|nr:OmpH family outer membrane protein [Acidobacteriota bacterium]